jgi:serine/threonine-protein kinase
VELALSKWPEKYAIFSVLLDGLPEELRESLAFTLNKPTIQALVDFPLDLADDLESLELPDRHADLFGTRFEDLGLLWDGNTMEVRRVRDMELGRIVVMEITKSGEPNEAELRRFLAEVKSLAQLHHTAIPTIIDAGRLADGRWFCTRSEARGKPLTTLIDEVHALNDKEWFGSSTEQVTMWSLLDTFTKVVDAISYAHEQGVFHRTLRPNRIFVGEYGQVVVGGWEYTRIEGHDDYASDAGELDPKNQEIESESEFAIDMRPSPAYLSPEYAKGESRTLDRRDDVYSLGAILYHILTGAPPYGITSYKATLWQVLAGPPLPLRSAETQRVGSSDTMVHLIDDGDQSAASDIPAPLVAACNKAMKREKSGRFENAAELAHQIHIWINGSTRQRDAIEKVELARSQEPEAVAMRARATALRSFSEEILADVPVFARASNKERGWIKEDEATTFEKRAQIKQRRKLQLLREALYSSPNLTEAHIELAAHHKARLELAEHRGDEIEVEWEEGRLRAHVEALPAELEVRAEHLRYLRGNGMLTITTVPEGAEVILEKYVKKKRRLVATDAKSIGRTPIRAVPIRMGSYRLTIRALRHQEIVLPIYIPRVHHWDGLRPLAEESMPIRLPSAELEVRGAQRRTSLSVRGAEEEGAEEFLERLDDSLQEMRDRVESTDRFMLHPDDIYVPGGWYLSGDPQKTAPQKSIWVDGFVVRKHPVSNASFVAFLDNLVATGHADLARKLAPREMLDNGDLGAPIYGQDDTGMFVLNWEANTDGWMAESPVVMVDWLAASIFARWLSKDTHEDWRLPTQHEWEKAARGVDGRRYPWGDFCDPSFCCVRESRDNEVMPAPTHRFRTDTSPYGVRGMAGNVREWTSSINRTQPWLDENGIAAPETDGSPVMSRMIVGNGWDDAISEVSLDNRSTEGGRYRALNLGFRLVRSVYNR